MTDFAEKLRTIGFLSQGRTRSRERSGRSHPDSGKPFSAVKDELGNVVTEHGTPGSGVSDRQDAHVYPDPVRGQLS